MSSSSSRSSLSKRSAQLQSAPNTLDTLLPYLLASKRSLSTIEHVYRANDICASTRNTLETSAITTAQTSFLRSGVNSQLNVLREVQQQTNSSVVVCKAEYTAVLAILDEAEKRLRATLQDLAETIVEAQLRPEGEEPRNLLDFVHKDGVEGLVTDIRGDINESGKAFDKAEKHHQTFREDLLNVTRIQSANVGNADVRSHDMNHEESPVPELLADMEERAKEMAVDLESLVSHFDLCVTAIKHTEGGGDAAMQIAGDLPKGLDVGQDPKDAPPDPMSDEEKADMMKILQDDAGQVEDVVMEIKSHISELETLYQRVELYLDQLAKDHENVNSAFNLLESIGQKLPGYITRNQAFIQRWNSEKTRIEERLKELDGAKGFYDDFLKAYDSLIIEIGRRKTIEAKRNELIRETLFKLETLYDEDLADREEFKDEQGQFLPVDIWPGLLQPPSRYDFSPADGAVEKVPDISKSVIHRAIRRVHGTT